MKNRATTEGQQSTTEYEREQAEQEGQPERQGRAGQAARAEAHQPDQTPARQTTNQSGINGAMAEADGPEPVHREPLAEEASERQ